MAVGFLVMFPDGLSIFPHSVSPKTSSLALPKPLEDLFVSNCFWWLEVQVESPVEVAPFWIGDFQDPRLSEKPIELALEVLLDRNFTVYDYDRVTTVEDARAIGAWNHRILVLAVGGGRYKDPTTGLDLAGKSCGNIAYVSVPASGSCPLLAAAHEVGHVLGRSHEAKGVMSPVLDCSWWNQAFSKAS